MEIKLKRIYQAKEDADGFRILVDKIYPRGIKKENLDVDLWDKEIAPSDAVRKAFHTSDDFETFKTSYRKAWRAGGFCRTVYLPCIKCK